MKSIFCLLSCCLLIVVVNAQTSTNNKKVVSDSTVISNDDYFKTHFLWFTGHWNDQKNIFITNAHRDSLSGSDFVMGGETNLIVSPTGNVTLQSKHLDDWNKRVATSLDNIQKFKDEFQSPSNDVSEWSHHFNLVLMSEIHDLEEEWQTYKTDKNPVLLNVTENRNPEKSNAQKIAGNLTAWCQSMKPEYDKVIAYCTAHRRDKDDDLIIPPPPELNYTCFSCDTNLRRKNEKLINDYIEEFINPENDLIKTALEFENKLEMLGYGEAGKYLGNDIPEINGLFYSKAGPCHYVSYMEMSDAVVALGIHLGRRAEKLLSKYGDKPSTAALVIQTVLKVIKQVTMLGCHPDEDRIMKECAEIAYKAAGYYSGKLIHDHDWSQLANIPFLFGLEKQHELLGGSENDIEKNIKDVLNSFHLRIEMDVKVGKEGNVYQLTHLKGETKIAPEFNYDNDSCYRWVAVEDVPNQLGFPKKKSSPKIECDLLDNEIVDPKPHPIYIGTKKYYTLLDGLKMDFCHPGKDTILLSSFIAEPNPNAGIWKPPGGRTYSSAISLEHLFQSADTMRVLAQSKRAKEQAELMKQQGEQIAAQMRAIQSQMGNKRNASNLENLHKIQDLATKAMNLGNNQNSAPVLSIDFPLQIQNNSVTLNDKRYDAKEINPREAPAIIYAYYTIKIIYEKQQKQY